MYDGGNDDDDEDDDDGFYGGPTELAAAWVLPLTVPVM